MKHAMWKVDKAGEFHFSDFTDAKTQLPLFAAETDYALLREIISYHLGHTEIEITVLGDWVVEETPFLRTHIKKQILTTMEKEGELSVVNPKPGRKPYTYPDGTILKFR